MSTSSAHRYSAKARWFHWSMAALVVLAYGLILSRVEFGKSSPVRAFVVHSHFWTGLLVLGMAFFRVAERRRHTPPPITPPLQTALRRAATLTHYALYAFLFVEPILGLSAVVIETGALPIPLTDLQIPSPFPTSDRLAEKFEDLHKLLASIFYWVIGLHGIAALWHHLVRKDDTLKRML